MRPQHLGGTLGVSAGDIGKKSRHWDERGESGVDNVLHLEKHVHQAYE